MELWSLPAVLVTMVLSLRLMMVASRGFYQYQGYALLLLGNLGFAAWVLFNHRFVGAGGGPSIELLIDVLASTLLVGVPIVLARAIRTAFADERLQRAAKLASWKELFVPGRASAAERELYEQMAMAHGGRVDEAISMLRRRLTEAEPPEDEAILERITTLLVVARRYREAVVQFETHFARDPARYPGLAIQMVQAYGALGELERAAELVQRLEETLSPQDPTGHAVLLQARLHLLAVAGAERAVERILTLEGLKRMPSRLKESFRESAAEHAARRAEAKKAANPAEPDQAEASDAELAAQDTPPSERARLGADPSRAELDEALARYLEGVAERAALDVRDAVPDRRAIPAVTLAVVAANAITFALFAVLVGDPANSENLLRGGASFHPAVRAGEWWRLWTALFLHDDPLYLFFNVYVIFLLGRLVEPALGSLRFLVVFCAAGLIGNLVSAFNPSPTAVFSMGASGAALGLMGALMVTLVLRRARYGRVRPGLVLNLALLLVVLVGVGFTKQHVDNFAHVGGLLAGAGAAALIGPGGLLGRTRLTLPVVGAAIALLLVSGVWSFVSLVREDPAATMARLRRSRMALDGVSMLLPEGSQLVEAPGDDPALFDHAAGLRIEPQVGAAPQGAEGVLADAIRHDAAELKKASEEHDLAITIEAAPAPHVAGWYEAAQRASEKLLFLYYARPVDAEHPDRVVLMRVIRRGLPRNPERMASELRRVLESVTIAPDALAAPRFPPDGAAERAGATVAVPPGPAEAPLDAGRTSERARIDAGTPEAPASRPSPAAR